jgi:hypothetical protein
LISPVEALSLLLQTLSTAWDDAHPGFPLSAQDVAITVPASFDPAAQQLTLDAARDALDRANQQLLDAAVRHAAQRLLAEPSRRKVLVVLSDGYPQDCDYGPDRNDDEYGIQDTAMALLQARHKGVQTFCITIDPSGHDYLRRMCPDEIVCCGAEFVFVPYVDPGLKLAQAIRRAVLAFVQRLARPPRVIVLANHGLITLGATPEAVMAATLMAVKAAEIFAGAVALGSPQFLSGAVAARIAGRPDELYRERMLGLR